MARRLPSSDPEQGRDAARCRDRTSWDMLREFTDKKGVKWRVYDVYPTGPSAALAVSNATDRVNAFPSRDHASGWLCFESTGEKRRLTPIPGDWELCALPRLEELCTEAGYVSRLKSRDADREATH